MVEAATLVPVVDSLEHKGYLKRIPDRMDRRRNILTITDTGVSFLASVPMISDQDLFTGAITSMDLSRQKDLLNLLKNVITKMTGTSSVAEEIHDVASQEYYER